MSTPDTSFLNFITDEHFREFLIADYAELKTCLKNGAWKSVHVLAGSIIEAVLVDYLLADKPAGWSDEKILEMQLGKLIDACKAKVLTDTTVHLCEVVREYRNLIHPGKLKREAQTVSEDGAKVADSLVRIVVKDVAKKKNETYGPTAEQILEKIESDPRTVKIVLPALVKKTNETELNRLLDKMLPVRNLMLRVNGPDKSNREDYLEILEAIRYAFRTVFGSAQDERKKGLVKKYADILQNKSEPEREAYECGFFSCYDLEFATPEDQQLIKNHVFSLFDRPMRPDVLKMCEGIWKYVTEAEINAGVADCVRESSCAFGAGATPIEWGGMFMWGLDDPSRKAFVKRIEYRRVRCNDLGWGAQAEKLTELLGALPF